jgi:thioredoxin reductase
VVKHLPADVERLYDEARDSHAAAAYTAAVLALRKLLMRVAVEKGAEAGRTFVEYVEYLDVHHYLGHDGKGWVDLMRTRGNEAAHEIRLMNETDSEHLLTVAGMLLKLVYEFPGNLPKVSTPSP